MRDSFAILCGAALVLTGCGTDVEWLLKRDSMLVSEADKVAARAEAVDPDLTTPMYDAEEAKHAACETIYQSISELMVREPSFGEQLVSDLGQFIAYFIPVEEIERCAEAQAAYAAVIEDLRRRVPEDADSAAN